MSAEENGHMCNDLFVVPLRTTVQFLYSRLLIARSYITYIQMREKIMNGLDTSNEIKEGKTLCWNAMLAQNEYNRLRPGFNFSYPLGVNPETLRNMVLWWEKLEREPDLCRDMDICEFLDRVETEVGK